MAGDKEAGWLNSLAALWNAESLEAWIAKLIAVLVVLLAVTGLIALVQSRGSGTARVLVSSPRPRLARQALPPKNRKKKQDKIVRRYRPRSHDGKKPVRRISVAQPVQMKPAPRPVAAVSAPIPAATAEPAPAASLWRSLNEARRR